MKITVDLVQKLRAISGVGIMDCRTALTECNGEIEAAMNWLREKGIAKSAQKKSRVAAQGLGAIFIDINRAVVLEINSETDFGSKSDEFKTMVTTIGNEILKSKVKTLDQALDLKYKNGTINDYIIAKTAVIGEKISLRRLTIIEKEPTDLFGAYTHLGGKIVALVLVRNIPAEVAKDLAMQVAAMRPDYIYLEDIPASVINQERKILTEQILNEQPEKAKFVSKIVEGKLQKFYQEVCLIKQAFIKDDKIDIQTYLNEYHGKILTMVRYEVGEGVIKPDSSNSPS